MAIPIATCPRSSSCSSPARLSPRRASRSSPPPEGGEAEAAGSSGEAEEGAGEAGGGEGACALNPWPRAGIRKASGRLYTARAGPPLPRPWPLPTGVDTAPPTAEGGAATPQPLLLLSS